MVSPERHRRGLITPGPFRHLIRSYAGGGGHWNLRIKTTQEKGSLGAVGAVSLLRTETDATVRMLNRDVPADLTLNAFAAAHKAHGGPPTVATVRPAVSIDLGVLEEPDGEVADVKGKRIPTHLVGMWWPPSAGQSGGLANVLTQRPSPMARILENSSWRGDQHDELGVGIVVFQVFLDGRFDVRDASGEPAAAVVLGGQSEGALHLVGSRGRGRSEMHAEPLESFET